MNLATSGDLRIMYRQIDFPMVTYARQELENELVQDAKLASALLSYSKLSPLKVNVGVTNTEGSK